MNQGAATRPPGSNIKRFEPVGGFAPPGSPAGVVKINGLPLIFIKIIHFSPRRRPRDELSTGVAD